MFIRSNDSAEMKESSSWLMCTQERKGGTRRRARVQVYVKVRGEAVDKGMMSGEPSTGCGGGRFKSLYAGYLLYQRLWQ